MAKLKRIPDQHIFQGAPISIRIPLEDGTFDTPYYLELGTGTGLGPGSGIILDDEAGYIVGLPQVYPAAYEVEVKLMAINQVDVSFRPIYHDKIRFTIRTWPRVIFSDTPDFTIDLPSAWSYGAEVRVYFKSGPQTPESLAFSGRAKGSYRLDWAALGKDLLEDRGAKAGGAGLYSDLNFGFAIQDSTATLARVELHRLNSEGSRTGEKLATGDMLLFPFESKSYFMGTGKVSRWLSGPIDSFGRRPAHAPILASYLTADGEHVVPVYLKGKLLNGENFSYQDFNVSSTGLGADYRPPNLYSLNFYDGLLMAGGQDNGSINAPCVFISSDNGASWDDKITTAYLDGGETFPDFLGWGKVVAVWGTIEGSIRFAVAGNYEVNIYDYPSGQMIGAIPSIGIAIDVKAASAAPDGTSIAFILSYPEGGYTKVFYSFDGGYNFEEADWNNGAYHNLHCFNGALIYASDEFSLYRNEGAGFFMVQDFSPWQVLSIRAGAPSEVLIGYWQDGVGGQLLLSTDYGNTFDAVPTGNFSKPALVGMHSASSFFVMNEYGFYIHASSLDNFEKQAVIKQVWRPADPSYLPMSLVASAYSEAGGSAGGVFALLNPSQNISGPIISYDHGITFSRALAPRVLTFKLHKTDVFNADPGTESIDYSLIESLYLVPVVDREESTPGPVAIPGSPNAKGVSFAYLNRKGGWSHFSLEGQFSEDADFARVNITTAADKSGQLVDSAYTRSAFTGHLSEPEMEELIRGVLASPLVFEWVYPGADVWPYVGRYVRITFDAKKASLIRGKRVPQSMELTWKRTEDE